MTEITRPVKVPQSTTTQSLTPEQLEALPIGGQYRSQQGQASATIERTSQGYKFTANCDSLLFLVTDLRLEVTRLIKQKTELETQLKEQKPIEVKTLSGWQKIRITIGDITLTLLGASVLIGSIYLIKKFKII